MRKTVDKHRGWHDMWPYALLGYRTTVRTSTGATLKWIDQLTLIDENRMVAVFHGQLYRQRMIRAFHKRVRARIFEAGQFVLKRIFSHQDEYKGKFALNRQGPYMVRKVLSGGAFVLSEMDDTVWPKPINSDAVKRYYV
ncbi:uncharacterized protein LOC107021182 [Solanum pennellii]|uniref:Uncharacterized protein LOC107021182 n=1 Tax=Solanum pennellii TaxID=28526 RepID=A0ABM1GXA7_SOLPN|nr:uncharacterized protein LOC107021182 [Solanum pennellii]